MDLSAGPLGKSDSFLFFFSLGARWGYGSSIWFLSFWAMSILLDGAKTWDPREKKKHLTTRKQNLTCLTCDLSEARTHSGEGHRFDPRPDHISFWDLVMKISKGIFPYPLIQIGQYLLSVLAKVLVSCRIRLPRNTVDMFWPAWCLLGRSASKKKNKQTMD